SLKRSSTCFCNHRASASFLREGNLLTACLISVTVLMAALYSEPRLSASGHVRTCPNFCGHAASAFLSRPRGRRRLLGSPELGKWRNGARGRVGEKPTAPDDPIVVARLLAQLQPNPLKDFGAV